MNSCNAKRSFLAGQASQHGQGHQPHHVLVYEVYGQYLPINFRVYDKPEDKTKNDYFQDMLDEVLACGLEPAMVTGESCFSGLDNLRRIKNYYFAAICGYVLRQKLGAMALRNNCYSVQLL